jgi:nucleoside-diphosphate-sugar epimerase
MENNFWTGKRVMVLGGAGFIGSHLVEQLVDLGASVRVVDNLSRGSKENLRRVGSHVDFLQYDLRDYHQCEVAMRDQEIVFNLAAKVTGIEFNMNNHDVMFEENMLLQMIPLKAAARSRVKKFIQVSTACVYPHDALIPTPESEGLRGSPEPTNEGYGWAKRMGEYYCKYIAQKYAILPIVVRFFNVFGPRDYYDDETSHVVPATIKKVFAHQPVHLWGSGNQTRSFVDVRDIATGLVKIAEKVNTFETLNLGHSREISMNDLVKLVQDVSGIHEEVIHDTDKPDGYMRRASCTKKMRDLLGWEPSIPIKQTIEDMIKDYKERYEK